jgi:hypothetical protein
VSGASGAARAGPATDVSGTPNYGIDADRVLALDSPVEAWSRRLDGRYAVDEFGGDPHLQDLLLPFVLGGFRIDVEHGERIPRGGPALLVANRSFAVGSFEPAVLVAAVRRIARRRLRVFGVPEVPIAGVWLHKLGSIGRRPGDVAALLRAGHLAVAPLALTWVRSTAGDPPRGLLAATLGFPVVPVAVRPGGPFGVPVRAWRVAVGEMLMPPAGARPGDQLAAAELSEQVRAAIRDLLDSIS